jgi:hypothetical protein
MRIVVKLQVGDKEHYSVLPTTIVCENGDAVIKHNDLSNLIHDLQTADRLLKDL